MAAARGRQSPPLAESLFENASLFDFFQAVRLLERGAEDAQGGARRPVGLDANPEEEIVRFMAVASLAFPPASIGKLEADPAGGQPRMVTTFFGLIGPQGVLPQHYSTLVIQRLRERDATLRDFLDLFHHRLVSLFYRAWEKHRHYVGWERRRRTSAGGEDLLTTALLSLVGLGVEGLRERLKIDDDAVVFYAGHFAHQPRSMSALEGLLADSFEAPLTVEPFQGRWLYLADDDCSRFSSPADPQGRHCRLGQDLIVGQRVWDVRSKFRIRVGPVGYSDFADFMPSGDRLLPLCQMTRLYVGPEYEFDVQVVLRRDEARGCILGEQSYLGWNTWTRSRPPKSDAAEAVFRLANV